MRRLWWFVLSMAMLTLIILPLMTRTNLLAEDQEKAKAEERQWGEEVNGCRISIQAKDYESKEYSLVTLSIIVKNTGKETVTFLEPLAFFGFTVTVKDAKGEQVRRTRYGEHLRRLIFNFEQALVELAPSEQKEYLFAVNRKYDMTLPGTYTIAATHNIYDAENKKQLQVKSNTITVKVPD